MGAALCRQTGLVHYEGFSSQREAACLNAGMVGFSWCRSALVALKVLGGIWYATALDTFPYFSRNYHRSSWLSNPRLDIAEGCAWAATGTYAMMLDSESSSNQTSGLNRDRFDVPL